MNSLLSIDPGLVGGWAWFPARAVKPRQCGVYRPRGSLRGDSWEENLPLAMDALRNIIWTMKPQEVACEWPAFFADAGGEMVAKKGDLVKLAHMTGWLACLCNEAQVPEFTRVRVCDWRGQLPDELVEKRVRKAIGSETADQLGIKSHAWDAVGIGLYLRGKF